MHNIAKLYYKSAQDLGLHPVRLEREMAGFYFTLGKNVYYFRGGLTPFNSVVSASIGANKFSTNKLLEMANIPVPKSTGFTLEQFKKDDWSTEDLTYPLVAKPTWDTACGYKVVCNIKDEEKLMEYVNKYIKLTKCISLEEYHPGLRSYRVLVYYGKVIGLVERIPAHIIGDGKNAIRELIKIQNEKRKSQKKTIPTGPISLNEETWTIFKDLNISVDTVPEAGEKIPLRYICNSTHGGTFVGLNPKIVCEDNQKLAVRAAEALGLNLAGFDVLCEDITKPIAKTRGVFIEVNVDPDITIHESGRGGFPQQVSKIMLKKIIMEHPFLYLYEQMKHHKYASMFLRLSSVLALFVGLMWSIRYYTQ
uniref:Cyanophycin synthetase n=2 Tax=Candidatus Berkiella cookevillensis TaxID=437022 RepID=A0A0Q9YEP8_9GAMM